MSEPQNQEDFLKEWDERVANEERERILREREREDARLAEIDKLTEDYIIPVKNLEPLKVKDDPMHLNQFETELFRYFEVNRNRAYTFRGMLMDLEDPRTPPICYWIDYANLKDRSKALELLKGMVLKGILGGEYDRNKKDYFYFFKNDKI